MIKLSLLISLLVLAGCSFKKSSLKNQIQNGHDELYAEPAQPKLPTLEEGVERIVIAATNDLQGNLTPVTAAYGMRLGGQDVLSQYLKILRTTYEDVILVDSGNFLPSKTQNLKAVQSFYEGQNYDAVTAGLNDFNLKVPKTMSSSIDLFKEFTKTSTPPLVMSNLFELKTGRTIEWEGSKPYVIKEVKGLKIGIIGLVSQDIASKTPIKHRTGLFVEDMVQSTLRHARLMRSLGVDLIVVMTHEGINCGEGLAETAKLPLSKVNFDPRAADVCNLNSQMGLFLGRLPPDLIDVVVSGRGGQKTANYVNDTLVISGYDRGRSISYVEFFVDKNSHKVLKEKTVVHQPVMTCHEFFKETNDCYTEDPSVDHGKRIPAKFLGQDIVPDVEVKTSEALSPGKTIPEYLEFLKADMAFSPDNSGDTQLAVLELKGEALRKILEEEFNHSNQASWVPNPFQLKADGLHLQIDGNDILREKTYRLLVDLESMLESSYFKKLVKSPSLEVHPHYSWNSSEFETDVVETGLAAPVSVP